MKYKLIASDFDNTLVNRTKKITPYTKEVLGEYMKRGGYFTIATGRMTRGMLANMGDIVINAPLITYQGAVVSLNNGQDIICKRYIASDTASAVIDQLLSHGLNVNAYLHDAICVQHEYRGLKEYCEANKQEYRQFDDLAGYVRAEGLSCAKILSIMEADKALYYERYFTNKYPNLCVTRSAPTFLEFNDIEGTKGTAVQFVADYLGVKREETMCFGDSTNDSAMIKYAGLGVAMGNAMQELIDIADIVCDSCDNDGLAKTIEKLCL